MESTGFAEIASGCFLRLRWHEALKWWRMPHGDLHGRARNNMQQRAYRHHSCTTATLTDITDTLGRAPSVAQSDTAFCVSPSQVATCDGVMPVGCEL